jgi:hypothetical protein
VRDVNYEENGFKSAIIQTGGDRENTDPNKSSILWDIK